MTAAPPFKIAVLDLYNGSANMGMDCIKEILTEWGEKNKVQIEIAVFDVRVQDALPDAHFDLYISSGGPGSPIDTFEMTWDIAYCKWLDLMLALKKPVLLICHSFQLACRHFDIGQVGLRKSKQLGILPIHPTTAHPIFNSLPDPFFSLESRLYQITAPNDQKIQAMGATIIALEKIRPQLPYERALMAVAFSDTMIGVQFHPEATQERLIHYFESAPIKTTVLEDFSEDKWNQIMLALQDDSKIEHTCTHFIPNFLTQKLLA
jgi:homoserine O-succinyltransferase/O-acetyltransferase